MKIEKHNSKIKNQYQEKHSHPTSTSNISTNKIYPLKTSISQQKLL